MSVLTTGLGIAGHVLPVTAGEAGGTAACHASAAASWLAACTAAHHALLLRAADSGAVVLCFRPGMSAAPKMVLAAHHLYVSILEPSCCSAGLPRALGAGDNCASRQSGYISCSLFAGCRRSHVRMEFRVQLLISPAAGGYLLVERLETGT